MSMKVNNTEFQTVEQNRKKNVKRESEEQTFDYQPTESDKDIGLKVESEHKPPRIAGTLSNMYGDNETFIGKAIKVDAAACDVILAPATTTIDIISGANDEDKSYEYKNGQYGDGTPPRTTGAFTRMFKGAPWPVRGCAAVVDVILSPAAMLIDVISGGNQDRTK